VKLLVTFYPLQKYIRRSFVQHHCSFDHYRNTDLGTVVSGIGINYFICGAVSHTHMLDDVGGWDVTLLINFVMLQPHVYHFQRAPAIKISNKLQHSSWLLQHLESSSSFALVA